MTNLMHGHWKNYFQKPDLYKLGIKLSPSAGAVFDYLCRTANWNSAVQLQVSYGQIAEQASVRDHKTIRKALRELAENNLVEQQRGPAGVYTFVMLDQDGRPMRPPAGRAGVKRYTPGKAQSGRQATPVVDDTCAEPPSANSSTPAVNDICRLHGAVEHWTRGRDRLCAVCHPNPHDKRATATVASMPTWNELRNTY